MSSATGNAVSGPKTRAGVGHFFVRLWKEKPLGTACGIIIVLFIVAAVFADVLAPYGYREMSLADRLTGPSARFLLGTDHVGRDLLTRLIYGARVSLTVGLAATVINVVVAMLIGGMSGFLGGMAVSDLSMPGYLPGLLIRLNHAIVGRGMDLAVQRFVDAWVSIPGLLILLTIMSIVGRGMAQIIVVLGVTGGIGASRVVRSAVIAIKENVYFQAAEAIGSSRWRTLVRHVAPNIVAPVIIVFSINIGAVIISEASLSFLGFGLSVDLPSWGGLLSREGRQYMEQAPWLAFWPGIFLTVLVYSLNMFGDAVRDLLDPRLRGGGGRLGREPVKRA